MSVDHRLVRAQFPALAGSFAYLENAGGAQVPGVVAEAIREYMLTAYVQLGAGYPQSDAATQTVDEAHRFMGELFNAGDSGRAVIGPSTTALINLLAAAYGQIWSPGDEIVIATSNHEANIGAWARLESRGLEIRWWPVDRDTFRCEPATLEGLLSDRTRMVTLPHVSNLVGQVEDVRRVCEAAHAVGARVCADGVAFAPHRAIDVQSLGVDWYVFSAYKVYGPHVAALFGTREAFSELPGPNHWFVPNDDPYKWELGGVPHEACAGLVALRGYLAFLAGGAYEGRTTVETAFGRMVELESPQEARLRGWLSDRSDLRIIGPRRAGPDSVGTVSFVHRDLPSDSVAAAVNRSGMGIRSGHMYAVRLLEGLGIAPEPGVVRVSLVHYNTAEEVEDLLGVLERTFED
jgi:cysteine desulfurase family protein (TIGR01976 family)